MFGTFNKTQTTIHPEQHEQNKYYLYGVSCATDSDWFVGEYATEAEAMAEVDRLREEYYEDEGSELFYGDKLILAEA